MSTTDPPAPETAQLSWLTRPDQAAQLVADWVAVPELRRLVEADSGTWPSGELVDMVEALAEFSTIWDRREGDNRLVFKSGAESRTDNRARQTYHAARALGLAHSGPPTMAEPDHLLILGGLATGVEPRVRYAAELLASGAVRARALAALGSFRPVDTRERAMADTYAPEATSELDLLTAMLSATLTIDHWHTTTSGNPTREPARAEQIRRATPGPLPVVAYAAASSNPDQRPANTADTYHQFAQDQGLDTNHQVLIITSSIYRPYQHLDAIRTLGLTHGVTIETVGIPTRDAAITHPPRSYRQEIRSTLRSARALLQALD